MEKTEKFKVLVPIGCRSDEGLSAPVIKRLKASGLLHPVVFKLEPNDFFHSYCWTENVINSTRPDMALLFADRVEMCGAAAACFHNSIPIAHVYAGVVNNIATFDDINRHVITLWSDIQFCEDEYAAEIVKKIKASAGLPYNVHVVGITHLDDLKVSEELVPDKEYDLVLYNPVTYPECPELLIRKELADIVSLLGQRDVIFIGPNPDDFNYEVTTFINDFSRIYAKADVKYYTNLPRDKFMGLLKHCSRFISNSSATVYEAPFFLKPEQIIHIGERNRYRYHKRQFFLTGASDEIVKVLEAIAIQQKS